MHTYTVSRGKCFSNCARKHDLEYVQGWRPRVHHEALSFGVLIHEGLAAYWQAIRDGKDPEWAMFAAIAGKAKEEHEQVRAHVMLEGYAARWLDFDRENWTVNAVEATFTMPVLIPQEREWDRYDGWEMSGKVDAVVTRGDKTYVVEHKTTSENIKDDAQDYFSRLRIDHQCSAYVLGSESLGHPVDGVIYDVLKKTTKRPLLATPVEARRYTKAGALYANQREKDETMDEYHARLREDYFGDLEAHYQRKSVKRTAGEMRDFLSDVWCNVGLIESAMEANYAPRNPDACFARGRCWAWDICSAGVDPETDPERYEKLDNVHPELGGDDGEDDA